MNWYCQQVFQHMYWLCLVIYGSICLSTGFRQCDLEARSLQRSAVTIDEPASAHFVPTYRSGTAARLAGIPVETLRVWERRYGVVGPGLSPRGHRLYSADDVSRLTLIKQLVDLGSPIGSIAMLPLASLR
jgi:hypothetical protein